MFLRILLSTMGSFLIALLFIFARVFILTDHPDPFILMSCLLGVYVGAMWGLSHKGVFNKK